MLSDEFTGKRLLLFALVGVTCFSMGLIYNAENKLFTAEIPTERTYVAPKMASYALRAASRESETSTGDEDFSIWDTLPVTMESDSPLKEEVRTFHSANREGGFKDSAMKGDGSKKNILKIMADPGPKKGNLRIVDSNDENDDPTKRKKPILKDTGKNKEIGNDEKSSKSGPKSESSSGACYRQVQLWRGETTPKEPKVFDCPGLPCGIKYVSDASYKTMVKSDALVLFHRTGWNWAEMQRLRPPNQLWFFHSRQSPDHTGRDAYPPKGYEEAYNYTISYRPSSDVYAPYGLYHKNKPQIDPDTEEINWAAKKKKLIAWVGSNCGGLSYRRQDFVKALAKRTKVDMYGACGNLKFCKRGEDCWEIIRKYKFYLALENSECRNYITEKFWHNALQNDVVPIVYGASRKDYERVAPPNSFIHLQDFKNFDELVAYIKLVDSNDTLYNSYMDWKRQGSVELVYRTNVLNGPFMCQVVSLILDNEKNLSNSSRKEPEHPNIEEFWTKSCPKQSGFPHDFSL